MLNRRNVEKQEPTKISENQMPPGDQQPEAVEVKSEVQIYSCSYSLNFRAFLDNKGVYKTKEGLDIEVKSEQWGCPRGVVRNLVAPGSSITSEERVHYTQGEIVSPFGSFNGMVQVHTNEGPRLNKRISFNTKVLGMGISGVSIVTPVEKDSVSQNRNVR